MCTHALHGCLKGNCRAITFRGLHACFLATQTCMASRPTLGPQCTGRKGSQKANWMGNWLANIQGRLGSLADCRLACRQPSVRKLKQLASHVRAALHWGKQQTGRKTS